MDNEGLSFSLKLLDKCLKKKKDKELLEKGGKIIAVIRRLRRTYNVLVRDEKGEEIPITIHQLHELFSYYFSDRARVKYLQVLSEERSHDLIEIANLREDLRKAQARIEQLERE
jgi:hypothetical protein